MSLGRLGAAVTVAASLTLTACASGTVTGGSMSSPPPTAASASSAPSLADTSWTLKAYMTIGGLVTTAAPPPDAGSIAFAADGTLSGSTGCNTFVGTYAQSGGALTIAPGPMTMTSCTYELASQEQHVIGRLPQVTGFTLGAELELKDSAGSTLLVYESDTP